METHGKDLIEGEVLRLQAELEDQRKMAVRLAVVEAQIRHAPRNGLRRLAPRRPELLLAQRKPNAAKHPSRGGPAFGSDPARCCHPSFRQSDPAMDRGDEANFIELDAFG